MPDDNEALVAHPNTNTGRITSPPGLWLAPDNDRNELAHDRSFGPCGQQSIGWASRTGQKDEVVGVSTLRVSN